MTTEQQEQLLETVKNVLDKHKEVAQAINDNGNEEDIISKFQEFSSSFNELEQTYSSLTGNEETEVQKSNKTIWKNLFGNIENFN